MCLLILNDSHCIYYQDNKSDRGLTSMADAIQVPDYLVQYSVLICLNSRLFNLHTDYVAAF